MRNYRKLPIYRRKINLREALLKFFSFIIPFFMILDAGGSGKLRLIAFVFIALLFVNDLLRGKILFNKKFLLFYFYMIAAITVSSIFSILEDVPLPNIITYNFGMYFLIIFYVIAKCGNIALDGYIKAAAFFSLTLVVLFFGTLFQIAPIVQLKNTMTKMFTGLEGPKPFSFGVFSIFYFQGTLAVIPACVYSIYTKKHKTALICLFGLVVSASRFGIVTVLLFFILFHIKKLFMPLIFVSAFLILLGQGIDIPVISDLTHLFDVEKGSGMWIRLGHIKGIFELFENQPSAFLLGQGPGTSYFSYGFSRFTDSIEVSQFDFLRKYGIFATFVIFGIYIYFGIKLYKINSLKAVAAGLLAHFFISFSNPVLLSLPVLSFIAMSIVEYEKKEARKCPSAR